MSIVRKRRPGDPGRLLKQYYMDPHGITISKLAEATRLSRKHVSAIVNARAAITAETATRLAAALGTTPQLWLNLQNAVDLYDAGLKLAKEPIDELRRRSGEQVRAAAHG
jgi:addiction module HigA family antidote